MSKVSLIVPVYNTEKYLDKCINSIINQTLKDIEIIIINDGSNDNSDKIIKKFKDKRIKYISKDNEGIGKTRNLGIKMASSEYLAFVDSDDYLATNFCEKMYNYAHKNNLDLVICNYFEDRGYIKSINFKNFDITSYKDNPDVLKIVNLGPCNKIYKNSFINNNNIKFNENKKYEDVEFVVNAIINASNIGKIDDYLTYYVIHDNSQTTTRDVSMLDIISICNNLKVKYKNDVNIDYLITNTLLDYNIQSRYIINKKDRNLFLNKSFEYLNKNIKNWKKHINSNYNFIVRLIKKSKILTKLYCSYYNIIK